jgi:hypothetical protein
MKKTPQNLIIALFVAIVAAVFLGIAGLTVWGWYPDSRINITELGGLTPIQVIARLGPPRSDPRALSNSPRYKSWTPEHEPELGPLVFYYHDSFPHWRGYEYEITFKNNHVVQVRMAHK